MFSSLYSSFSGLFSFSKGLNVISNNVGNLNTPGYKSADLSYFDSYYQYRLGGNSSGNNATMQIGSGVQTGATNIRFTQGELRDTGNDLDAAIDGNGFFILRNDGIVSYTRAGQFKIDSDGYLVDSANGYRVAAFSTANSLVDININGHKTSPANPTSEVIFTGNLSTGSTTHQIDKVEVYDSTGAIQQLKLIFTNNSSSAPGSWLVEVQDSSGSTIANGEVRYQGSGSPQTGFNTFSFSFAPTGASATTITLNFGDPGSFSGSTSFSGGSSSTLAVESQDGYAVGSLTKMTFLEDGSLQLEFSNGQKETVAKLALALFTNPQDLTLAGKNLFRNESNSQNQVGYGAQAGFGKVTGGKVELSNVELTEQFTNMIVLQRGYQASSQIISITNEMIQQLLDLKSKG